MIVVFLLLTVFIFLIRLIVIIFHEIFLHVTNICVVVLMLLLLLRFVLLCTFLLSVSYIICQYCFMKSGSMTDCFAQFLNKTSQNVF